MAGHLVWIDCEMTGLDPKQHQIIEVACIITDKDLNQLDHGVQCAIHVDQDVLDRMGDWCKKHHAESGLSTQCLGSTCSLSEADALVRKYIEEHLPGQKGRAVLAGNSVHTDKVFLEKDMPLVAEYLHYRIVDVSSVKELAKRWNPRVRELAKPSSKPSKHRALDDIQDSISELRAYRRHFFRVRKR